MSNLSKHRLETLSFLWIAGGVFAALAVMALGAWRGWDFRLVAFLVVVVSVVGIAVGVDFQMRASNE